MAPPSTPDNFPSQAAFDYLILIEVGPEATKRTFQVFKGVICFYSGYFATSLNSAFREAHNHVVRLPTEDPLLFAYFHHWLYTRTFFDSSLDPAVALDFDTLARLWVFGDAHDIPMLQNEVIDILRRKMDSKTFFSAEVIAYIYDNTVESSTLRHLVKQTLKDWLGWTLWWGPAAELENMDCEDVVDLAGTLKEMDYDPRERFSAIKAVRESLSRYWQKHEEGEKGEMRDGK
ncbi:hypothetical protein BDY17DRAFT_325197 [Neohortaea acidophila]|uniref:BTB domain-containing protein n=1 Tax=Neohortaea acidophila TaxID=245834 RepID=A0A6A6PNM9_9PEZI|nr:uncharacterized protein BDY17DRAFT_325197 [Neohortaea acidophila]KAF2481679.1 hypothetical protein BDY17DRAFT_325197 [Neohortaea acidophila]